MNFIKDAINKMALKQLHYYAQHPEKVTSRDEKTLEKLYGLLCRSLGISESAKWCIDWTVEKFKDREAYEAHKPKEICVDRKNGVLDNEAKPLRK